MTMPIDTASMDALLAKMNAIRDKYKKAKTDAAQRQKMNAELMALYQTEGYNPMSGCLPVLLQLPVLVAFYNVLSRTIELRHAPFVLWIKDLSAIDHTYVLVILMIVSMYAQQAMTPSTLDPTQTGPRSHRETVGRPTGSVSRRIGGHRGARRRCRRAGSERSARGCDSDRT